MTNLKRNSMLNLLKGFACIGVVFIHISFPNKAGEVISKISAYAVPVFFLIAGYYSFNKPEEIIKRRLFKILKIFIFAYIVFFLCFVCIATNDHNVMEWFHSNYNLKTPIKYIVFCTIDFAIPLWYLLAQIETYVFWYFIVKHNKQNVVIKLIPVLFLFFISLTCFCETMEVDWYYKINFISRSLSWFALGYYINLKYDDIIEKIDIKLLFFGVLIGSIITCIPSVFCFKINFSSIGNIPYSTSLFLIALKKSNFSVCKPIEYLGDKLSLWVYIFHVPTSYIVVIFCRKILKINTDSVKYLWIKPIIVLLVVIFISYVFNYILDKIKLTK